MSGIKFATGGPSIPFKLLKAQERGEVVFLCGAGISMRAGLPDFYSLTENIYRRLHEDWNGYPAEAEGMVDRAHAAPDRTLFALQRRLGRGSERVRAALIAELLTDRPGTDAHYNLLRLSRDNVHQRIVTTNFDTLFERAWLENTGTRIDSWAAAGMPGPGSTDFRGVFHLHGRLRDDNLNLAQSDLVLTSAEFGDAYLRSGWASRYLYDLLLHSNVVIAGYRLNDPPTRYLFEAMSADRERFQFKNLYALAPASEAERDVEAALWKGRGVEPLLYEPDDVHSALYQTIAGWAEYADRPTNWARENARAILAGAPAEADDDTWNRLDWILSRADGDRILEEINPSSTWLGPLLQRASRRERQLSMGGWIASRLKDRDMITAALRYSPVLDNSAREAVGRAILRNNPPLTRSERMVWRLAVHQTAQPPRVDEPSLRDTLALIKAGDVDYDVRASICSILAPRPTLSVFRRWPGADDPPAGSIHELANVEFDPSEDHVDASDIIAAWPPANDATLLGDLDDAVSRALQQAADLGVVQLTIYDIPSIAEHDQNEAREGFAPIVRCVIGLWERLASSDPSQARHVSEMWRGRPFELNTRMWLHALSLPDVYDGKEVGEALNGMEDDCFWGVQFQREVMRLTAVRWSDLPSTLRDEVEARLIAGDPR